MREKMTGRVTIPTDMDVVPQTLEIMKRWGADAIRDCDGTDFPQQLRDTGAKVYATYYTTRKDNDWARAHPEEVQQCYIMTGFYTAQDGPLAIPLMKGISPELMQVNTRDDIRRWWEVVDRSTGTPIPPEAWRYDAESGCVILDAPEAYHEYTVSFLAYLIWDPVHMYNAVTNGWKDFEHQITFDVRQPKTHAFTMERLRRFIREHDYVDVLRFTTFFHQFTLVFDELCREYDIPFWNFNTQYDEIGLDLNTDFYDKSHLNYRGAEKFSNYFAEKISPYFPEQKTDPKWDALYEKYQGYTAGLSNKS